MSDSPRPLYVLPFRVVVAATAGFAVLAVLSGALGAWVALRQFLRVTPDGERAIERVERVTVTAEESLARAAQEVSAKLAVVRDASGRDIGQAVPVTADGIFVSGGPLPKPPVQLQLPSGNTVSASIVRVYRDSGVFFLRAAGSYAVPAMYTQTLPPAGSVFVAVAQRRADSAGPRVRIAEVESLELPGRSLLAAYPGLALLPKLTPLLPPSFQSAFLAGADGKLHGLVLIEPGGSFVIPGTVIDFTLRDLLQHAEGTTVTVFGDLRGRYRVLGSEGDAPILAFRVTEVIPESPFATAGIVRGDEIQRIGGQPLIGTLALVGPLQQAARERVSISVEVLRGAERLTRAVSPTIP